MSRKRDELREEAILVLAPTGCDANLAASVLEEHGFSVIVCPDLDALCVELEEGAGVVLLAEEALAPRGMRRLSAWFAQQPPWSDLALLFISGAEPTITIRKSILDEITPLDNVAILERPLRIVTLVSMIRVALRARRRQYHVRSLLERLERNVHERDHFLAMLGHELRNPLAAIVLGLRILARVARQDPEAQRGLERIERQSRHLTRLVDDLLDISRVTSGRMILTREPTDLAALVERCVEEARKCIHAQELSFDVEIARDAIVVDGDPVRLEQVIQNLLTNSIKYTPPGGRIRVAVKRAEGQAVITIEDTGLGIAKEMIGRIFEPFTQEKTSLDRAQGGLGLGLSVVRGLLDLHGGAVEAESEGSGRGSRFTVRLPLSPEPSASAVAAPVEERPAVLEASRSVVVIEDNDDIRESLKLLLEMSGYRVATAADGPSGVALVLAEEPDGALVDIGLPGLDGYGVARAVRASLGDRILLVAATGYGQPEDAKRAKEAGFDAHVAKPVDIDVLEALLAKALKKGR